MRAVNPKGKKILTDEDGAIFLGGRGHEAKAIKDKWKRYPWATHEVTAESDEQAKALVRALKDYAKDVA